MHTAKTICISAALLLCACATTWDAPDNVRIRGGKDSGYLDVADFFYKPAQPVDFSKLKTCITENVTNRAVTLTDSANSFTGPFMAMRYNGGNSHTVPGGDIFKMVDEAHATLFVSGNTGSHADASNDIAQFDLRACIANGGVTLKFINITSAQRFSGMVVNDGFTPVELGAGARARAAYEALQGVAERIKTCLQ